MPPWLPVTFQIVMPVLAVIATAVISLNLRFAPSKEVAIHELKQIAFRVIQWISNLSIAGFLVYDVLSNDPLTRWSVFVIAFDVATLMFMVTLYLIKRIHRNIFEVCRCINRLGDIMRDNQMLNSDFMIQHLSLTETLGHALQKLSEDELKQRLGGSPPREGVV